MIRTWDIRHVLSTTLRPILERFSTFVDLVEESKAR